ncbi:MAG: Omp28-related outer membrane protein, partial [Bacteroidia bacterium]|nr:Omp28-related outer membrane protein [Bacteroidia bacterium]
ALSTLAGSAAGLFGDDASAIDIEEQRKARALQRNQWANPDNEEISGLNKLGSIALTLPMQIANAGLSPADTADRLKAAGETNATAIGGAGIDAAGNALGMILPGFKQGTAAVRGLTGFGANAAQDELGKDKFIIMAVHAGSYAAPAAGWANFTTAWGAAIDGQASVAGYPAGTINRIVAADLGVAPQKAGGTAMSRGSWKTAAQAVLAMPSPVNVGAMAEYNSSTKELTVNVDAYYTADETAANNINVAFLRSKLMSKQSGDPTSGDLYEQNHVLRNLLTGQWGDVVTETKTTGTKVRKTYTYPVPADYNGTAVEGGGAVVIENCSVVVFISRGKTDVLTAVEIPITVK